MSKHRVYVFLEIFDNDNEESFAFAQWFSDRDGAKAFLSEIGSLLESYDLESNGDWESHE